VSGLSEQERSAIFFEVCPDLMHTLAEGHGACVVAAEIVVAKAEAILAVRTEQARPEHVVHVTVEPVAEDVVWCDDCEEWVTSGAPDRADALEVRP
jgi:hypothetical protein